MNMKNWWLWVSMALLATITVLSLWPLPELPAVPGTDKLHHLTAYAVLAIPVVYARPRHWGWVIVFFVGYSGLIELIQPYMNRYGEWLDLLANVFGLMLGGGLAMLARRFSPAHWQHVA